MLKHPIIFLLAVLMTACSAGVGDLMGGNLVGNPLEGAAPAPVLTPVELLQRPLTAQPASPTPLPTRTPSRVNTLPAPSQLVSPVLENPTPTSGVAPQESQFAGLCSPLEFVALEDLRRVMSDSYRPPARWYSDARHPAVDFAYYRWKGSGPIAGTGVQAVLQGVVAAALSDTFPFGNLVIVETPASFLPEGLEAELGIEDGTSLYILYAHLDENSPQVSLGEAVGACQNLGFVGMSGNAGAAHLHLETRLGPAATQFPVFSYYRDTDPEDAKANYRLWSVSGKFRHFDPMRLLLFVP